MRCCGGVSSLDWSTSSWTNQTQHQHHHHHHHHHRQFVVPESCCFERGDSKTESNSNSAVIIIPQMAPVCRNDQLTPADNVNTFILYTLHYLQKNTPFYLLA